MQGVVRSVAMCGLAAGVALLSGCGMSSYGSAVGASASASPAGKTTGTSPAGGFNTAGGRSTGTHNSIVATPQSSLVSVQVGQKQTVAVTFTSSDGQLIEGLDLTDTTLPAGWSGPTTFGCARVDSGSSCVLDLVYAPTAYETGKRVTLNYEYVDNSGAPITNAQSGASISMSFAYQGTTDDNVLATPPPGQVQTSLHGAALPVTVSFVTDDGHPAANLQITAPGALTDLVPPAAAGCVTVSAATPCTVTWLYQPMAPESGTVTYSYTYANDSGIAKSGSFNVAYQAIDDNAVTYDVAPSATPLVVATHVAQTVVVSFVSSDGFLASNLQTLGDLSLLGSNYPGWSAAVSSLNCARIDNGTGCQLTLTYCPGAPGQVNTLAIPFTFISNAGVGHAGTLLINYRST